MLTPGGGWMILVWRAFSQHKATVFEYPIKSAWIVLESIQNWLLERMVHRAIDNLLHGFAHLGALISRRRYLRLTTKYSVLRTR